MSSEAWLERKLCRWQQLREEGKEASANELCAEDAEAQARPELRYELRQAILRLKQQEGFFGQLHREPLSESTVLQRDPGAEQRRLHGTNPTQSTLDQRDMASSGAGVSTDVPDAIGRYRIDSVLGQGSFGRVFLAYDEQLQRRVAIKVPHARLVSCPEDAEPYLKEARTAAELDHPNIVPVHDVGSTEEFPFFVVSKFIEGTDLSRKIKEGQFPHRESAMLVATVADALHYVHRRGLVHRDVKPANILIDPEGTPYVVDFGVALKEHELGSGPGFAGTPAYMSPEQARSEGHLVDGRSDIFSLGILFYELLTSHHPFSKTSLDALLEQIARLEVRPPRQRDDTIPKELERICLKALAKRPTERYTTALDMAEDLRQFLNQPTDDEEQPPRAKPTSEPVQGSNEAHDEPAVRPTRVVPKGLRSFDSEDADFFLDLVPGPRDRQGLPEAIRFWKTRIEQTDPDRTFRVGLIYGPSGSGKSSLVRAGLLPCLAEHVIPVYIQATGQETELQLLRRLYRLFPDLPADLDVKGVSAALRRDQGIPGGKKVVVLVDQFEQWLHAKSGDESGELAAALRQCDGARLQCILMVRDDFWMAVTRFMRQLDIPLLDGENCASVDLFDVDHAQRVLTEFGVAYGRIPEESAEITSANRTFIAEAISALSQDGRVICVRLALFVEMMKGRPWEPSSLREVGGVEGVGVSFLEDAFASSTASPQHRFHQRAARLVLEALLPEAGAEIKGHMRSEEELLAISRYVERPKDFSELINTLDTELRLITPTDPESSPEVSGRRDGDERFYQLTHDYLVPALREWLTRKKKETWRGRAELRLAERSALWNTRRENRHLPALWEYVDIRWLTRPKYWTPNQRTMMQNAARFHLFRVSFVAAMLVVVLIVGLAIRGRVVEDQNERDAKALVERLLDANIEQVPGIIRLLAQYRPWTDEDLKKVLLQPGGDSNQKQSSRQLRASIGLLPMDPRQAVYLHERVLGAEPNEVLILRQLLLDYKAQRPEQLWSLWEETDKNAGPHRLRAACLLAEFDKESERWKNIRSDVASQLVSAADLGLWKEMLRPVCGHLVPPLSDVFLDSKRDVLERSLATSLLAEFAKNDPRRLVMLLGSADPSSFRALLPVLRKHEDHGVAELDKAIADAKTEAASLKEKLAGWHERLAELEHEKAGNAKIESAKIKADALKLQHDLNAVAKRQANWAVVLVSMEHGQKISPLLASRSDSRLRNHLIHRFSPLGASPEWLIKQLYDEASTAIRQAVLLSLGEFTTSAVTDERRQDLIPRLVEIYRTDPDAGVHAAADWLLRKWGSEKEVNEIDKELMENENERRSRQVASPRRWFVNSAGHTFVVFDGGEFMMGSPNWEHDRDPVEQQLRVHLNYRFAIASKEVTWAQFERFQKEHPDIKRRVRDAYEVYDDQPCNYMTWYEAAAYCNWLSTHDGISDKTELCYVKNSKGVLEPAEDFLKRRGFRLPTEAEWEYACRAGTLTSRCYGDAQELLDRYAWYLQSADSKSWRVGLLKPNDMGLFDMHGNVGEWCNDWHGGSGSEQRRDPIGPAMGSSRVVRGGGFLDFTRLVRSASREHPHPPDFRNYDIGFRLAKTDP